MFKRLFDWTLDYKLARLLFVSTIYLLVVSVVLAAPLYFSWGLAILRTIFLVIGAICWIILSCSFNVPERIGWLSKQEKVLLAMNGMPTDYRLERGVNGIRVLDGVGIFWFVTDDGPFSSVQRALEHVEHKRRQRERLEQQNRWTPVLAKDEEEQRRGATQTIR